MKSILLNILFISAFMGLAQEKGISEEALETYQGDIGVVLDTRDLAKKGYRPAKAKLEVKGTSYDYSTTIAIDPYTFMGQLKLPVEQISADDREKLKNGVDIIAIVVDVKGRKLLTETFNSMLFKSNPTRTIFHTHNLPDLNTKVHLVADTPYYIQAIADGKPGRMAAMSRSRPDHAFYNRMVSLTSKVAYTGNEANSAFYFEAVPGKANHFYIRHGATDTYVKNLYVKGFPDFRVVKTGYQKSTKPNFQFVVHKVGNGVYRLTDTNNAPIKITQGMGLTLDTDVKDNPELRFRLVPMQIDWSMEEIETHHLEPVLPPAQNGFSYNSTLINCGTGPLEQTIGNSKTVETQTTIGWEESFSFMSSNTTSASLTLGLEVEAKFFGNGAKYSAEATGSTEFTTQNSQEKTHWNEVTATTSETFFSERKITVPAKSAVLAYDAYQSYENIKVNVVQRLRVKGRNQQNGRALTGAQVTTQFHLNGFDGVITKVGPDYAEITVRAVATMDTIFKSKSDVQEVTANCSNP